MLFSLILLFSLQIVNVFSEEITILGNDYKIPKIYKENGYPKGILVDIAEYIDMHMKNYSFNIKLYPWARAYNMAVNAEGGIIGLSKTEERLKIFDYSDVIYFDEVIIVVMKGSEFNFEDIADLKGKTIGIGRGGSFGDEYEEAKKEGLFNVEQDDGPVIRLKMLLDNRIDCALISPGKYAFYETLRKDKHLMEMKDEFIILSKPFKRDPNYLGFPKKMKMQDFLNEFNNILQQGYENGDIQKLIDNYTK